MLIRPAAEGTRNETLRLKLQVQSASWGRLRLQSEARKSCDIKSTEFKYNLDHGIKYDANSFWKSSIHHLDAHHVAKYGLKPS